MDPALINSFIVVALMLLGVTALLLVSSAIPLMGQAGRTLIAWEKLADTLQSETKPTLTELKEVLAGVNQLKSVTAERVTEVGHKVENVAGSFTQVADQAKRQSSVFGAGLFAGVKAYLTSKDHAAPNQDTKQITALKGEPNVE